MTYPTTQSLIESFKRTHWIITKQTEGLTQADSLLQPPQSANCMNWVVGHIVASRNGVLTALGETAIWDEPISRPYSRESEPITSPEQARPLDQLLAALDQSQRQIIARLERISPAEMEAAVVGRDDGITVEKRVAFLHWHETYHTGQLELLRQLAGKTERII